jgi:hypothetical protein
MVKSLQGIFIEIQGLDAHADGRVFAWDQPMGPSQ